MVDRRTVYMLLDIVILLAFWFVLGLWWTLAWILFAYIVAPILASVFYALYTAKIYHGSYKELFRYLRRN